MTTHLNEAEQDILLKIARESLELAVHGKALPKVNLDLLPEALQTNGASFVTLTKTGRLRGCIGALEAYQPLAVDVQTHAVEAALEDFRFTYVQVAELPEIEIEVSVLTPKTPLTYTDPEDLVHKLRPGVDGVILQDPFRKATFLPQVWESLSEPEDFLSHLCLKMGAKSDLWREKPLLVFIYQVQEFHE